MNIERRRQWLEQNKDRLKIWRKEYNKRYKEKNKAALIERDRLYYHANKELLAVKRKQKYATNEQVRENVRETNLIAYQNDKEGILARNKERHRASMAKIAEVALHYGCQNPKCNWKGSFISAQLHFHHIDRATKCYSVSAMGGLSLRKIAQEINKCCVLCACCHAAVTTGAITIDNICCNIDDMLIWK